MVLVTDRTSSFAIVIYDDLSIIQTLSIPVQVGFNAGDRQRYLNIPVNSLQQVNVYRIDGMCGRQLNILKICDPRCFVQKIYIL